jgi:hypothetical protein
MNGEMRMKLPRKKKDPYTKEQLADMQKEGMRLMGIKLKFKVTFTNGEWCIIELNGLQAKDLHQLLQRDWQKTVLNAFASDQLMEYAINFAEIRTIVRVVDEPAKADDGKGNPPSDT